MAGSKSDYLENKILDLILGGVAFAAPANVHFGLFTVSPSDAGGGTEVAGNGYARVSVANTLANFPAAVAGAKSNAAVITWPTATAPWGVVLAVGIFDAAVGGNLLFWTTITSKTIDAADTVSIGTNGITLNED